MIRPEHPFDIRPDLRKSASTKAESTKAVSVIRPNQLERQLFCLFWMVTGLPIFRPLPVLMKLNTERALLD